MFFIHPLLLTRGEGCKSTNKHSSEDTGKEKGDRNCYQLSPWQQKQRDGWVIGIRPSRMNLILLVFLFFPLPALFHFLSLPRLTSCLPPPSDTHCCSWSSPWESDCSATSPKQNMYRVTGTAHLLRNQTQKMLAGTKDHRRPEAHFTPTTLRFHSPSFNLICFISPSITACSVQLFKTP